MAGVGDPNHTCQLRSGDVDLIGTVAWMQFSFGSALAQNIGGLVGHETHAGSLSRIASDPDVLVGRCRAGAGTYAPQVWETNNALAPLLDWANVAVRLRRPCDGARFLARLAVI